MNGLETAALVLVALWLGSLTLLVVLVIRQVALLTERVDRPGAIHVMEDGPALGSRAPDEVLASLPRMDTGVTHLLLLSASCTPCRQLAEDLRGKALPQNGTTIALVPGRKERADDIAGLLPGEIQVIRDPDATELAHVLALQRVPAAITVERGIVIAKAPPLSSASELLGFLDRPAARSNSVTLVPEIKGADHGNQRRASGLSAKSVR
jgi:hypothetical protein